MLDRWTQNQAFDDSAAPLLLLPGTLCDARLYAEVLARLDVRAGVGTLTGAESAAGMAQFLLARAPARLSLCGFSLGAIVALEMVAQAPERIERLALIGCNPGVLDRQAAAARAALSQAEFARGEDFPIVKLMAAGTAAETYRQQTLMTLNRTDSRPRLAHITAPTLVLCGANDHVCPPAMSTGIADAIAGARLVIVPEAGHYLPIEQPQAVAEALAAWLAMPANPTLIKEAS